MVNSYQVQAPSVCSGGESNVSMSEKSNKIRVGIEIISQRGIAF